MRLHLPEAMLAGVMDMHTADISPPADLPFSEQPLGFCDMGSGDGAWLEHVYHLVSERTERGRLMRAFPHDERYRLLLVGVDYDAAAREATRARLERPGIPHLVLAGSIDDPGGLRAELAADPDPSASSPRPPSSRLWPATAPEHGRVRARSRQFLGGEPRRRRAKDSRPL